jgi:hypothetical protein
LINEKKYANLIFRIGRGEQKEGAAPTAEINNFIDTFLVGQIEVGTPRKYNILEIFFGTLNLGIF